MNLERALLNPSRYSLEYGSNGERDHIRSVARAALSAPAQHAGEEKIVAAWRVILWYRRVRAGFHPLDPGMDRLTEELAQLLGEPPADLGKRACADVLAREAQVPLQPTAETPEPER